jgi:tetratricopeptide (TPR) repeat protein
VKARWWVARSRGKWKIYDFEVLEKGVRSSVNIAAAMDETGPHGFTPRYFEAMSAAHEAAGLLGQGEFDQAEQKLRATLDVPLPKPLAAWRLSQLAIVETSRNHWDEVLDLTSRAAELNPDMPLLLKHRAQALNGLGRFQEAAAEAREYIAELGGDDHGSFLLGTALAGMEKNDEAADAFREGLDDYSDSVDNLVGLAGVLPGEQMQEVADRFSQFEQPEARFSEVADQLVTQENATALAAVLERNRELAPLDPHNSYYEGELHRLRGE